MKYICILDIPCCDTESIAINSERGFRFSSE